MDAAGVVAVAVAVGLLMSFWRQVLALVAATTVVAVIVGLAEIAQALRGPL